MSLALKEYHQREPRYVLRPDDRMVVRFATPENKERSYSTRILNVSESGMAFSIQREEHPQIDDIIMVEFTVPGAEQMACYARVTRIEEILSDRMTWEEEPEVIVGVQFCKLTGPHVENLSRGLSRKFKQLQREEKINQVKSYWNRFDKHKVQIAIGMVALIILGYFYYALNSPLAKKNSIHKVPWIKKEK